MSHAQLLAEERLFDPPCLGIPAGAQVGARACGPDGRFVEIALLVDDNRVVCAGFLADSSGDCLWPASRWCELAQGRTAQACLQVDAASLARGREDIRLAELCLEAGRAAVAAWIETARSEPSNRGA